MKLKISMLIVLPFFVLSFTQTTKAESPGSSNKNLISKINSIPDYTYVRVLVDGKWYIYVYDSGKLIDAYPE